MRSSPALPPEAKKDRPATPGIYIFRVAKAEQFQDHGDIGIMMTAVAGNCQGSLRRGAGAAGEGSVSPSAGTDLLH